jgi:hypothetical protein
VKGFYVTRLPMASTHQKYVWGENRRAVQAESYS